MIRVVATASVALTPVFLAAETGGPLFAPVEVEPHVYDGGWEHFVGGGVAVFDCNQDGLPELYAAGGSNAAQLYLNTSGAGVSFDEATPLDLALTGVTGAYPLDIDSDGFMDLAVMRVGADVLLRGVGECRFEPFDTLGFTSGDQWTTAFSATWEDGQTLPTLAFGTYVDRSNPDGPFEACDATMLYRPEGEAYGPPLRLEPGFCALSLLFSDWGRTGRADLRISNDRHYYVRGGQEQLWSMDAEPRLFGQEENWQPYSIWGMGIASRDLTGDGFPEVYLTSMGDQKFQQFDPTVGGPVWRDVTYEYGTTAHRPHVGGDGRPSTGWHAQFGDVTNDGRDDIFVSKGNVEQMPGSAMEDPNSLLEQRADGTFTEVSGPAGIATFARSRGAALADFDQDGRLDLAVVNRRAPMEIYQNTSENPGNWLAVSLEQTGTNRNAVGSFIELRTEGGMQTREVTIGGGHASGQATPEHFGLGQASTGEIRVIWPDATVTEWRKAEVNRHFKVTR
ncbi:MAG: CRTAC1 family protein [Pseudomonadota bacterium]